MGTAPLTATGRWFTRASTLAKGLLSAALGFAAGAALVALGQRFGVAAPAVVIGVPIVVLSVIGVLADARIGVLLIFASFPLGSASIPLGLVELQVAEAVSLFVAGLVILRRMGEKRTPLPWAPALWWPVALIAWSLVAMTGALDRALAIKQVLQLGGGLLFACVFIAACVKFSDVRLLLGGLTAAACVVAVTALAASGEMRASFGGTAVSGRLQGVFNQPNEFGSFCSLAAIIAVGFIVGGRTRRVRLAAAGATLLLTAGLLLSLSRGAWVGTTLAIVFLIVSLRQARRAIAMFSIPLVALAFALGAFAPDNPQLDVIGARISTLTVLSPYDERDDIWAEAQREILERPLTGFGPGNFPIASTRSASESATVRPHHAHNLLLTWAAETGLPSAFIIVAFGVALFIAGRRAARAVLAHGGSDDRAIVVALQAALLAIAGQGIVDYTLRNPVIFLVFWGVIGGIVASERVARET